MASNSGSDYDHIVRHCLKTETLWEDPEFPAVQSSVFYHQTPPFSFQWKRPHVRTFIYHLKSILILNFVIFLIRPNCSECPNSHCLKIT